MPPVVEQMMSITIHTTEQDVLIVATVPTVEEEEATQDLGVDQSLFVELEQLQLEIIH